MGCGASSPATEAVDEDEKKTTKASSPPPSEPSKDANVTDNSGRGHTRIGDASVAHEYAAVGATAGVVAGAAAAAAAANPDLLGQTTQLSRVTGEALLELAKTLPIVAPVAFLIGAIASSAVTAVNLKGDCMEFGRVVSTLEAILVRAENLENKADVVADVKQSLEEALQLMQRIQDRGFLTSTFFARADQVRFDDIKERIEAAIHRLNLSATVDTAVITQARFKQSEQLKAKVAELGGAEKVASDPTAMKQFEAHMDASEALIAASVTEARKDLKAIGEDVTQANKVISAMEAAQKESIMESRMTLRRMSQTQEQFRTEQNKKLDDVTESFVQLQQQSELQRLQNDILKQQVDELKSMLSDVKNSMTKFPVPAKEPERMLVVNTGGMMTLDEKDAAFETLQHICVQVTLKYGLPSYVNIVGNRTQYTAAGYMPATAIPAGVKTQSNADGSGEQTALNLCHLTIPRKVSVCQHVVSTEKPLVFEGLHNHPAPADDCDFEVAARVDDDLRSFLDSMASHTGQATHSSSASEEEARQFKMQVVFNFLQEVQKHPETYFYAGVPIKVGGQSVGSLCILGTKKPPSWIDADVIWLENMAEKVVVALERQLESNKRKNAQKAMMEQMMQMQMQMQMQMMSQFGMQPTPA